MAYGDDIPVGTDLRRPRVTVAEEQPQPAPPQPEQPTDAQTEDAATRRKRSRSKVAARQAKP